MLLRGGLGSLGLKVASATLSMLMAVVLARSLGADGYGVYAYVIALVTLLALPAQVGLPTLVVRETAKSHAAARWGLLRGLWRWSSRLAATMSALLLAIAMLVSWLLGDYFSSAHMSTFYCGLLLVPLIALGNLRGAALRGLRKVVQGQLPETVLRPGALVILIVLTHNLFKQEMTPALAMAFHAIAAGVAFVFGAWILRRAQPEPLRANPTPEYEFLTWRRTIMPLALISGVSVVNAQMDILMLGWFRSAEDVGLYKVAASSVSLIGFGMTALTSVVAPHFARLYAQKDMATLQKVATRSAQAMTLLGLPVFIAFTLAGEWLLEIAFGEEFVLAYVPLAILSVGNLIGVAMGAVGALLNMTGHERDTARGATIAAVSNIVLNSLLIPLAGSAGAAIATAASLAIYSILLQRCIQKRLGISSAIIRNWWS